MNSQMQMVKIARQYAEQVVAGEILACRWVQRACQRQLDDLAKFKGKASPYRFNPKLTDKDGRSFQPVDTLATTRDQARIVFGNAQAMARRSPGFCRRFAVEVDAHNMHVLASGWKFETGLCFEVRIVVTMHDASNFPIGKEVALT